jgi:hypothetical protein
MDKADPLFEPVLAYVAGRHRESVRRDIGSMDLGARKGARGEDGEAA